MNGEAIVSVSAAVVALTQFAKWAGINERIGPLVVLALSALGVGLWAYSTGTYQRTELFGYFAGWVAVATGAAGVFGFTRAAGSAVTSAQAPPRGGAGSDKVSVP